MERRRCQQCDTVLARDNDGTLCSACRTKRSVDDNAPVPPATLWDRPDIRAAIDARHIGRLFRAYRQAHNPTIPQETLARWVQLTQGQISIIERTRRPVTDLERLERWCNALHVPTHIRWFRGPSPSATTEHAEGSHRFDRALHNPTAGNSVANRPHSWDAGVVADHAIAITQDDLMPPSRRVVLAGAATFFGATLAAELEPFLQPVTATPRRGTAAFTPPELAAAEKLAATLRQWHRTNSGLARSAVVAQLHHLTNRLREAPHGTRETQRAFRITAELADTAATMAWDAGRHATAQRYFVLAAQLAHAAGDDSLAAVSLASLARQCFDLGRPADGLEVVQLAQYGTRRTATPRLRAVLATREAWSYALTGDARAFQRTVGLAEDYHAEGTRDRDAVMPSARSMDAAELAGVIGARYRDLAQVDVKYARTAQEYIGRAIQLRSPSRPRNRAFDLIGLARTHLITREPEQAATLIRQAIPLASSWTTGRVGSRLRDFHQESGRFSTVPAVRDAREAISALAITT